MPSSGLRKGLSGKHPGKIVKRSDQAKGFAVLPKRWLVERTLLGSTATGDLPKDRQNLNRKALAFLAPCFNRRMLRNLCNPA